MSGIQAFDWRGFGTDSLFRFSNNCRRASANWLSMGLQSAIGGKVWNTGVGTGIGASTQSGSSSTWEIVAGSTPWNSKGSTRGEDEQGCTGVQGIPDWRYLDLLGRPEVNWLIVWLAREIELLPEERAADWWDIRTKTQQELVGVYRFCQGQKLQ